MDHILPLEIFRKIILRIANLDDYISVILSSRLWLQSLSRLDEEKIFIKLYIPVLANEINWSGTLKKYNLPTILGNVKYGSALIKELQDYDITLCREHPTKKGYLQFFDKTPHISIRQNLKDLLENGKIDSQTIVGIRENRRIIPFENAYAVIYHA